MAYTPVYAAPPAPLAQVPSNVAQTIHIPQPIQVVVSVDSSLGFGLCLLILLLSLK